MSQQHNEEPDNLLQTTENIFGNRFRSNEVYLPQSMEKVFHSRSKSVIVPLSRWHR